MALKRKDNRGRILQTGESQRKDGRYVFKYLDNHGEQKFIYSWKLNCTDPLPKGKRECVSLRELEQELQKDRLDGIDSSGKKMTDKFKFKRPWQVFDCIFTLHGLFFCVKYFKINQSDRAARACVLGALALVVHADAVLKVIGPAGVQSVITAPDNVCVIHGRQPSLYV